MDGSPLDIDNGDDPDNSAELAEAGPGGFYWLVYLSVTSLGWAVGKWLDNQALKESRLHGDDLAKGEASNILGPSTVCCMFSLALCLCVSVCVCLHLFF